MASALRVRMDIKLYENDKLVSRTTKWKRSQARAWVEAKLLPERTGRCRVWYNKAEDFWNEFEFSSFAEFKSTLAVDTEPDLVETFVNAKAA